MIAKWARKTRIIKAEKIDFHTDVDLIDKYEAVLDAEPSVEPSRLQRIGNKLL